MGKPCHCIKVEIRLKGLGIDKVYYRHGYSEAVILDSPMEISDLIGYS